MDISKTYIAMCNCPEIQGNWICETGDWFYKELDGESWIKCQGTYRQEYHPLDKRQNGYSGQIWIWLPRQDQLQEMLGEDSYIWFQNCYKYVEGEPLLLSAEMVGLERVMWEKHRKTWDGEKWHNAHWTDKEVEEIGNSTGYVKITNLKERE